MNYSNEETTFIADVFNHSSAVFVVGGNTRETIDIINTPMFLKGNDEIIIASIVAHMKKNKRVLDLIRKTMETYNRDNN